MRKFANPQMWAARNSGAVSASSVPAEAEVPVPEIPAHAITLTEDGAAYAAGANHPPIGALGQLYAAGRP